MLSMDKTQSMKLESQEMTTMMNECSYVDNVSGNGNDFDDEGNSDKMTLIARYC
jgi:hypothetical protein